MEISAKNNINVNECFDLLVDELLKNKNQDEIKTFYLRKTKTDLSISSSIKDKKKSKECCWIE